LNNVSGYYSSIGAGQANTISADRSSIGAGQINKIGAIESFIGAGVNNNIASGRQSGILAGVNNTITNNSFRAAILGGENNIVSNSFGAICCGEKNNVSGFGSVICGGQSNTVSSTNSVICGGTNLTLNQDDTCMVPRFRVAKGIQTTSIRTVDTDTDLNLDDYIVMSKDDATITLPDNPITGQTYIIKRIGDVNLTLEKYSGGPQIRLVEGGYVDEIIFANDGIYVLIIVYNNSSGTPFWDVISYK
jgi:hypothetical protein